MRILVASIILLIASCNACKKPKQADSMKEITVEPNFAPGPATLVYKTKTEYINLVPVTLNEDKSKIIAYPNPNDLKNDTELRTPKQLKNGWLLDEKGINENVAFLNITYQEYALLDKSPSIDSLFSLVIDNDPILKMCNCGNRNAFKNIEVQLNSLIENDILEKKCMVIK